jgi:hypothetical protein
VEDEAVREVLKLTRRVAAARRPTRVGRVTCHMGFVEPLDGMSKAPGKTIAPPRLKSI